jgi:hypothetical protein
VDPGTTIVAILEKASMLSPSAKRPLGEKKILPRTTRVAAAAAALAFAVAAVAVVRVAKSDAIAEGARASGVQPRVTAALAVTSPLAVTTTESASIGATLSDDTASADRDREPAKPAEPLAPPRIVAAAPPPPPKTIVRTVYLPPPAKSASVELKPEKPVEKPVESKSKDCAIPFTIDEFGHRHYKVECVH